MISKFIISIKAQKDVRSFWSNSLLVKSVWWWTFLIITNWFVFRWFRCNIWQLITNCHFITVYFCMYRYISDTFKGNESHVNYSLHVGNIQVWFFNLSYLFKNTILRSKPHHNWTYGCRDMENSQGALTCRRYMPLWWPPFQAPRPLQRLTFSHLALVLMPSIFCFLKNLAFLGQFLCNFGKISALNTLILVKICSQDPRF